MLKYKLDRIRDVSVQNHGASSHWLGNQRSRLTSVYNKAKQKGFWMGKMSKKVRHLATVSSALAVMSASSAYAQELPQDVAPADQASDPDDIVVTAQRRSESIQSVPVTVQAISGDALKDKGVTQIQDLQQLAPNVSIASTLGPGSAPAVSIRGIGLNDFNTNNAGPNGIYVDEFYLSAPNSQSLSFFDIERVEVLKGPQGTLYGRNSSGGALNITTVKPSDELRANARVAVSSFETVNAEFGVGGPLGSTLSGRLSGLYNYSRGFMYNHFYDRHESGINMFAVRGQLLWKPDDRTSVLLKSQFVRNVTRSPQYKFLGLLDPQTFEVCAPDRVFSGSCVDLYGYAGRPGQYEGDWGNGNDKLRQSDFNTTLKAEFEANDWLTISYIAGYNYDKRIQPEDTDMSPSRLLQITYGAVSHEFTNELRLSGDQGPLKWVLGGYYIHERIKQNQPLDLLLDIDQVYGPGVGDGLALKSANINRQTTSSEAVFGQVDYEVLPGLNLTAGARYTWEKKRFGQFSSILFQQGGEGNFAPPIVTDFLDEVNFRNFSWRLAANYKIDQYKMLYASVATGFKAGGYNGTFLDADPAIRLLQLQPFKPEKVTSYEVGLKSELLDRSVTFNLALFYNDYRNQQLSVLTPGSTLDVFSLTNAQKARTYGADVELAIRPVEGLRLTGNFGYLNTKMVKFIPNADPANDYSGNRLSMAPEISLSLGAAYKYDLGNGSITLSADSSYRSKVFFQPSNNPYDVQKGYWLHSARIGYEFSDDRFELAAFVRNLTDEKYTVWRSAIFDLGFATNIVGPPRSFGLEFSAKY